MAVKVLIYLQHFLCLGYGREELINSFIHQSGLSFPCTPTIFTDVLEEPTTVFGGNLMTEAVATVLRNADTFLSVNTASHLWRQFCSQSLS